MKASALLLIVLFSLSLAWEGEDPPVLDQGLRTGVYSFDDVVIRDAPSRKQDGSAWDPFGGLPDLYITVFTSGDGSSSEMCSTREIENSGSTASWANLSIVMICGPEQFSGDGDGTESILFKVWDSDTYDPDFVDSGEIQVCDLVEGEPATVQCSYGSQITFTPVWLGMQ